MNEDVVKNREESYMNKKYIVLIFILIAVFQFNLFAAGESSLKYSFEKHNSRKKINQEKSAKYFNKGNEYNKDGNYKKAVKMYKKALKYNWKNPKIHYNIGTALFYSGRYSDARTGFLNYLKFKPTDIDALHYLGLSTYKLGNINKAVRYFKRILDLDPYNELAQKNYQKLKELQVSTPVPEKRIPEKKIRDKPSPKPVKREKNIAEPSDDIIFPSVHQKKMHGNKKISELDNKIAVSYRKRGFDAFKTGDYKNAEYYYIQSLKYDDANYISYYNVGVIKYFTGDYEKAKSIFQSLIKIKQDADALTYLGICYYKTGNNNLAAEYFNKALSVDPSHAKASKFIDMLRRLY